MSRTDKAKLARGRSLARTCFVPRGGPLELPREARLTPLRFVSLVACIYAASVALLSGCTSGTTPDCDADMCLIVGPDGGDAGAAEAGSAAE
jgi:hypothetical protein